MQVAEQLHDERIIEERLRELRRSAGKVRREHGDRRVQNWPRAIRASALALVGDGVSVATVAEAVGVVLQTIGNWQKSGENKPPVRELRIVPDSPNQPRSDRGVGEAIGEAIRIRVGEAMEILIPPSQFKSEWLLMLSRRVQS